MSTRAVLLTIVISAGSAFTAARAGDTWSEPYAGVRYLHRTTSDPKYDIHLCFIKLDEPGIRITSTVPEDRSMSTPQWAKKAGVQIAINGGMGGWDRQHKPEVQRPSGPTIGDGNVWPDPRHEDSAKDLGSFMEGGNRIEFVDPFIPIKPESWVKNLLTGTAILVKNGQANEKMTDLARMNPRNPRTAVGASKDHQTLILLVVDGRQKTSVGMTGKELQKVFLEFNAGDAINFDGGGSSCMYMEGDGVLNKPSDGQPRHVTNHLGIFARKGPSTVKGKNAAGAGGSDPVPGSSR